MSDSVLLDSGGLPESGRRASGLSVAAQTAEPPRSPAASAPAAPSNATAPSAPPGIEARHLAMLRASGLDDATILARGYRSVSKLRDLEHLGFSSAQRSTPTLLVPIHDVHGRQALHQHRPDSPRVVDGKPVKYETPKGARMLIDVPPAARPWLEDPGRPLFITEGVKKADAAVARGLTCIALLGVWNWRGSNEHGGKVALSDWELIALEGRTVVIVFDSDVMTKPSVYKALTRLKEFLESRGAFVRVVYLPGGAGGAKVGLDDYLADGHTVDGLLALATDELRAPAGHVGDVGDVVAEAHPYVMRQAGTWWRKSDEQDVRLANFSALIKRQVREVVSEDEVSTYFDVAVYAKGGESRVRLSPAELTGMAWPLGRVGSHAILEPGLGTRDRMAHAIQVCSREQMHETVFAHPGWTTIGGDHVFLHQGGGIGPRGAVDGIAVRLPASLSRLRLPAPVEGDKQREVIQAVLRLREVAPQPVGWVLIGAAVRSVLGHVPATVFIAGTTGTRKSALAALSQSFFGAEFWEASSLLACWSSTDNALEGSLFAGKDVLTVVDDFVPGDTDPDKLHARGARVLRGQANGSFRHRLSADLRERPPRPPRGGLLATGEETPRGSSVLARCIVVPIGDADVRLDVLTNCQQDARDGVYARAMACYLRWLAVVIADLQADLRDDIVKLREEIAPLIGRDGHARSPEAVAELLVGLHWFLRFADSVDALGDGESHEALLKDARGALIALGRTQTQHAQAEDPARAFLTFLGAALGAGRCHLRRPDGTRPDDCEALGWTRGDSTGQWEAGGDLIGHLRDGTVYLDPDVSLACARRIARESGAALTVSRRALLRRMDEQHLLAEVDPPRGGDRRLTVRPMFVGSRRPRVAVALSLILGTPAHPAHPDTATQNPGEIAASGVPGTGPESGPDAGRWARTVGSTAQQQPPDSPGATRMPAQGGPDGPDGPGPRGGKSAAEPPSVQASGSLEILL